MHHVYKFMKVIRSRPSQIFIVMVSIKNLISHHISYVCMLTIKIMDLIVLNFAVAYIGY